MLISQPIYNPRYISRFRYAQIGAVVLSLAICGYLAVTTLTQIRQAWQARQSLARDIVENRTLRREAARLRKAEASRQPIKSGGVDMFAVTFAAWAREKGVTVESMAPEGSPAATEIKLGESKLGVWNANKVRIRGQGAFAGVMGLLKKLRRPETPVQLESFVFQSSSGETNASVSFDLLLTVYEKKIDGSS